eukprot:2947139-Lingulodinium_polyedra.AAC.1
MGKAYAASPLDLPSVQHAARCFKDKDWVTAHEFLQTLSPIRWRYTVKLLSPCECLHGEASGKP